VSGRVIRRIAKDCNAFIEALLGEGKGGPAKHPLKSAGWTTLYRGVRGLQLPTRDECIGVLP